MQRSIKLRALLNPDPERGETQENISIKSTSANTTLMPLSVCFIRSFALLFLALWNRIALVLVMLVKTRQFMRVSRRRFVYTTLLVIMPFVEDDIFALSSSRFFFYNAQPRQVLSRWDSVTVMEISSHRNCTVSPRLVVSILRQDAIETDNMRNIKENKNVYYTVSLIKKYVSAAIVYRKSRALYRL